MRIFRTWTFKWWEVGIIKVCLLSMGVLLGLYFYEYLLSLMWFWWILMIITLIYFIVKMVKEG